MDGKMMNKIPAKKSKTRKQPQKQIIKELDSKIRQQVFERDGYRCVLCNSTETLQWSHLISRKKISTRWDPINSVCMCARCHYRHHMQGPEYFTIWFLQTYGEDVYEQLVRKAYTPTKREEAIAEAIRYISKEDR